MAAETVNFGITRHAGALIESLDDEAKIEVAELKGSNGNIARVNPYNDTTDFNLVGHGDMSLVPGIGDPQIDGLPQTGITIIKSVKHSEKNDNYDGWELSGTVYPHAETPTNYDGGDSGGSGGQGGGGQG